MTTDTDIDTPLVTGAQTRYILALLKERTGYTDAFAGRVVAALSTGDMPRIKASEIIDWLLLKPRRTVTTPAAALAVAEVVAGAAAVEAAGADLDLGKLFALAGRHGGKYASVRCAVPGGDEDDRLKVKIKFTLNADKTDWFSATVFDAAVYGHGSWYGGQRKGQEYRGKIADELRKITAAPQDAVVRYTELTGQCGVCGRPLEQKDSVARGIGPVCASRLGLV